MISVGILGAGPSGLAAAHAAKLAGAHVSIYSRPGAGFDKALPKRSDIFGAQYLHEPLPGIDCGDKTQLAVQFIGDADGYRDKVYGPDYRGTVSPQQFEKDHFAWDLRAAYDDLWNKYFGRIIPTEFSRDPNKEIYSLQRDHDFVISTIPRRLLCVDPSHDFRSQIVYAIGDAPRLGVRNPVQTKPNTLVYNGSPDYGWYRTSNIFGHSTAEWSSSADRAKPPIRGLATVEKPLSTNCDCHPGVFFKGRYGEWKKGILVHHVFNQTQVMIERAGRGIQDALF